MSPGKSPGFTNLPAANTGSHPVSLSQPAASLEPVRPRVGRSRIEKPLQEVESREVVISEEKKKFCCNERCSDLFESLSDAEKEEISTTFACEKKMEKRNKLLQHVRSQGNLAVNTDKFSWKGASYCNVTFARAVNSSVFILDDILKSNKIGVKEFIHGNQGVSKFSLPRTKFIVWMRSFLLKYAQSAPDSEVQVLNHWLTKTAMFQIYRKETTPPQIAEKTFYDYMKTYFGPNRIDKSEPQIRISKHSSHSVCDQCLAFSNARRCSKTEEELITVNLMKSNHLKKVSGARQAMEELKQSAIQFPDNSLVLQLDGMDNHKSYTPREQDKSKRTAGLLRLPTKITGCIIYSGHYTENRKVVFYVNHDHFEQASNMVISTLFKLLQMFLEDHGCYQRS